MPGFQGRVQLGIFTPHLYFPYLGYRHIKLLSP